MAFTDKQIWPGFENDKQKQEHIEIQVNGFRDISLYYAQKHFNSLSLANKVKYYLTREDNDTLDRNLIEEDPQFLEEYGEFMRENNLEGLPDDYILKMIELLED